MICQSPFGLFARLRDEILCKYHFDEEDLNVWIVNCCSYRKAVFTIIQQHHCIQQHKHQFSNVDS